MTTPMTRYCIAALLMVTCLLNTAQGQVCTDEYAATILTVDWESFSCGQPSTVTVTVRNDGTLDWQRIIDPTQGPGDVGFKLGLNPPDHNNQGSIDGPSRVQMDEFEVVGCGELKQFVFTMTPDAGLEGHQDHAYVFQMVDEWDEWFGEIEDSDAIVECDFDNCTGIPLDSDLSWAVAPPAVMECGQLFEVQVRAQNTGTRDWRAIDNIGLAARQGSAPFGVDPMLVPGGNVDCDSEATFIFPITAPEVETTTSFSLMPQMRAPGTWFGDSSLTSIIDVHCDNGNETLPPPIASDDVITVCENKPAIVDALANDSSPTGVEPTVSLLSSSCGGPVTHLGDGVFDVTGALLAAPSCYFDYQLAEGIQTASATVTLTPDLFCNDPEPVISLTATPDTISLGDSTLIGWDIQNAAPGSCVGFVNDVQWPGTVTIPTGSTSTAPTETTTYRIECSWSMGVAQDSVMVTVIDEPEPVISLTATPDTINLGDSTLIEWTIQNAAPESCVGFANDVQLPGTLAIPSGSTSAAPAETTTYKIECSWGMGVTQALVTVTVIDQSRSLIAYPDSIVFSTPRPGYPIMHQQLIANDDPNTGVGLGGFTPPAPEFGTLELIGAPDVLFYTPPPGFAGGNVTFIYFITDGTETSNNAAVTLSLPALPLAVNDNDYTTAHAQPINISFETLLSNDQGVGVSIYDFPLQPQNGSLIINDSSVSYTPISGYSGSDTFTYRIIDSSDNISNQQAVSIQVTPVAVVDGPFELGSNTELVILVSELLANDHGSGLTFENIASQPSKGNLRQDGNKLIYQPNQDASGNDSFTYKVADQSGQPSDAATVLIALEGGVNAAYILMLLDELLEED